MLSPLDIGFIFYQSFNGHIPICKQTFNTSIPQYVRQLGAFMDRKGHEVNCILSWLFFRVPTIKIYKTSDYISSINVSSKYYPFVRSYPTAKYGVYFP